MPIVAGKEYPYTPEGIAAAVPVLGSQRKGVGGAVRHPSAVSLVLWA